MVYYYKAGLERTCGYTGEMIKIKRVHPRISFDRKKEMAIGPLMYCYLEFMTFLLKGINRVFTEFQIEINDRVVSKAVIMSKVPIYKFMPKNGLHLGFCFTDPDYRGRGYYPYLLKYIQNQFPKNDIYMIVSEKNIPSIRGIEKSGFKKYGTGSKKGNNFIIENYV